MAYKYMGCSFMDGVLGIYMEVGYTIMKVIVYTWVEYEGDIHGGSP